jgi:hypothetical protein
MMSEDEIRHLARLVALENVVQMILALMYRANRWSDADIVKFQTGLVAKMRAETFPGADPAISDLLAAEIEDATRSLLDGAVAKLRLAPDRGS